jgi:hyperosmotically inducible periplasmic protein
MTKKSLRPLLLSVGSLTLGMSVMATPVPPQYSRQREPDNTKNNSDQSRPTAGQQKNNSADMAITQKIRKAAVDDKDLSTQAHNIKIITQDGKVTLRGPVKSEKEKDALQAKAVAVAGESNVTNELEVERVK